MIICTRQKCSLKLSRRKHVCNQNFDHFPSAASSNLSTEPAVSTDGLGSTGSTSAFSAVLDEKPYRPSFVRNANKENFGPLTEYKHQGEDILQQWRLRRKMEEARLHAPEANTRGKS